MALVCACLWAACANTATSGVLRGVTVDSEGSHLQTHIIIHPDLAGRNRAATNDRAVESDRDGRFRIELDAGFYGVCVMADAFVPICQKIRVDAGKTLEFRFRLDVDAGVIISESKVPASALLATSFVRNCGATTDYS